MSAKTPQAQSELLGDWFCQWNLALRRFLRLKRNCASAEIDDIAQETYLRLLRYDRSELVKNPQAYLFTVAANVAIEWAGRSSRRQPHRAEWLEDLADADSPESALERQSAEAELLRAINGLPARHREILRLHFGEGLTHDAIADRLGLTRRIVKRDICAAYAGLRSVLPGFDSSGAALSVQCLAWDTQ